MKTRTARIAGSLVAISLLVAACGDDDDDAATATEAPSEPADTAGAADTTAAAAPSEPADTAGSVETAATAETTPAEGTETKPRSRKRRMREDRVSPPPASRSR